MYPQTSGQSRPSFAAGRQSNGGDLLAVPDRHPRPWFNEPRKALGKHFALTERIAAVEFPHGESKLNTATSARNILQAPMVMTLDGRGRFRTERTARRRVRCNHRNHQAGFCNLDLINEHPFRQWEQWRPFHDHLALSNEILFRRFLMEGNISHGMQASDIPQSRP